MRKQFDNQADAIREFDRAGFGPTRIAEILGTTAGTVNVALARAKRAPKKPAQPKGDSKA